MPLHMRSCKGQYLHVSEILFYHLIGFPHSLHFLNVICAVMSHLHPFSLHNLYKVDAVANYNAGSSVATSRCDSYQVEAEAPEGLGLRKM